jgi:GntR family transcriptional regulator/MocR family aminotransferase
VALNETSQPLELLLSVSRDGEGTLGAQIEEGLRQAIRTRAVKPGAAVPSTRDLARQLGVSRRVVVDAYGQLAAEGYLSLRQGARPRVSDAPAAANGHEPAPAPPPPPRFDFRPSVPDVSSFPRAAWLRATREALATMPDADLQYGDWIGLETLRQALADYLGRVRGVVADASRVVITSGYTQALTLLCHALATGGARRIAIEDPANPEQLLIARRAGLEPVPIAVDDDGLRVQELADEDAVVLTPAHQHPTGAVLSGERRAALLAWLRDRDALAIEDDYDAEYRYDRAAIGALQGLEPDRVAYAGSASKTLAPALRLGWLVVPPPLLEAIRSEKYLADMGTERIGQQAFAHFLERGELDRHLRRMRGRYRARRDALVQALADELPDATVKGIAAGLHVTAEIPGVDERALAEEAARRRIRFNTMLDYRDPAPPGPATLMLGYGQLAEPAIRAGVRELAAAVTSARASTPPAAALPPRRPPRRSPPRT